MKLLSPKFIATVFLFLLIVSIAFMVRQIIQNQITRSIEVYRIPNLALSNLNGEKINIYESSQNQYILLSFVQSDCDFCLEEINQLSDSIDLVKDMKVFLISSEPTKQLEILNSLITNERIILLSDKGNAFTRIFKVNNYPSLFLFDKDKNLIKYFKGSVSVSEIASETY